MIKEAHKRPEIPESCASRKLVYQLNMHIISVMSDNNIDHVCMQNICRIQLCCMRICCCGITEWHRVSVGNTHLHLHGSVLHAQNINRVACASRRPDFLTTTGLLSLSRRSHSPEDYVSGGFNVASFETQHTTTPEMSHPRVIRKGLERKVGNTQTLNQESPP